MRRALSLGKSGAAHPAAAQPPPQHFHPDLVQANWRSTRRASPEATSPFLVARPAAATAIGAQLTPANFLSQSPWRGGVAGLASFSLGAVVAICSRGPGATRSSSPARLSWRSRSKPNETVSNLVSHDHPTTSQDIMLFPPLRPTLPEIPRRFGVVASIPMDRFLRWQTCSENKTRKGLQRLRCPPRGWFITCRSWSRAPTCRSCEADLVWYLKQNRLCDQDLRFRRRTYRRDNHEASAILVVIMTPAQSLAAAVAGCL